MARRDFDPATVQPDGRPATKARLFDPAKDELFSACIARESGLFIEAMSVEFDPSLRQRRSGGRCCATQLAA